jgi:hypothetical protein
MGGLFSMIPGAVNLSAAAEAGISDEMAAATAAGAADSAEFAAALNAAGAAYLATAAEHAGQRLGFSGAQGLAAATNVAVDLINSTNLA